MNLTTGTATVHKSSATSAKYSACEPNGASRGGYVKPLRPTNRSVTCKKCLKK